MSIAWAQINLIRLYTHLSKVVGIASLLLSLWPTHTAQQESVNTHTNNTAQQGQPTHTQTTQHSHTQHNKVSQHTHTTQSHTAQQESVNTHTHTTQISNTSKLELRN